MISSLAFSVWFRGDLKKAARMASTTSDRLGSKYLEASMIASIFSKSSLSSENPTLTLDP
jgi:hypothetical protein